MSTPLHCHKRNGHKNPLSEGMDFAAAQLPSTIPKMIMSYCQGESRENSSEKHFQKFPYNVMI
jgi:hypothetical protein